MSEVKKIRIKSMKKLVRWIYGHWGHDRFMDHQIMVKPDGSWEMIPSDYPVESAYVFTYGSVLNAAEKLRSITGSSMMDAVTKIIEVRLTALVNKYYESRETKIK